MERAIFAGGCFWCMVQPFEELVGLFPYAVAIQVDMYLIQAMSKFVLKQQGIPKPLRLFLILKK